MSATGEFGGAFAAFDGPPQLSLLQIGQRIQAAPTYKHRLKWLFEFFRGVGDPEADLAALIAEEPAETGDVRFDAFLAASAEYVALHHDLTPPPWCFEAKRVLPFGWHIAETQQARRWAYGRTPGPFLGRGIYIEERELGNV